MLQSTLIGLLACLAVHAVPPRQATRSEVVLRDYTRRNMLLPRQSMASCITGVRDAQGTCCATTATTDTLQGECCIEKVYRMNPWSVFFHCLNLYAPAELTHELVD